MSILIIVILVIAIMFLGTKALIEGFARWLKGLGK